MKLSSTVLTPDTLCPGAATWQFPKKEKKAKRQKQPTQGIFITKNEPAMLVRREQVTLSGAVGEGVLRKKKKKISIAF